MLCGDKDETVNHIIQQSSAKEKQDEAWQGGKGDSLGIVQEIDIWPYYQMVYAQTRTHPRE